MPSFEEEAFARAQQLNLRGRNGNQKPLPPPMRKKTQKSEEKSAQNPKQANQMQTGNLLENLFKNNDKSIVLILLILLMEENSDPALILSLVYLLM